MIQDSSRALPASDCLATIGIVRASPAITLPGPRAAAAPSHRAHAGRAALVSRRSARGLVRPAIGALESRGVYQAPRLVQT